MNVKEKIAYLKGLLEGSDLKLGDKEKKIMDAMMDALVSMSEIITDIDEDLSDLYEGFEGMCESIDEIEDDIDILYNSGDFGDIDMMPEDDDPLYDVECPNCHEMTRIDEDTLMEGDINCPKCGELLEFDIHCDCGEDHGPKKK